LTRKDEGQLLTAEPLTTSGEEVFQQAFLASEFVSQLKRSQLGEEDNCWNNMEILVKMIPILTFAYVFDDFRWVETQPPARIPSAITSPCHLKATQRNGTETTVSPPRWKFTALTAAKRKRCGLCFGGLMNMAIT